jgi:hypothetical protein
MRINEHASQRVAQNGRPEVLLVRFNLDEKLFS